MHTTQQPDPTPLLRSQMDLLGWLAILDQVYENTPRETRPSQTATVRGVVLTRLNDLEKIEQSMNALIDDLAKDVPGLLSSRPNLNSKIDFTFLDHCPEDSFISHNAVVRSFQHNTGHKKMTLTPTDEEYETSPQELTTYWIAKRLQWHRQKMKRYLETGKLHSVVRQGTHYVTKEDLVKSGILSPNQVDQLFMNRLYELVQLQEALAISMQPEFLKAFDRDECYTIVKHVWQKRLRSQRPEAYHDARTLLVQSFQDALERKKAGMPLAD